MGFLDGVPAPPNQQPKAAPVVLPKKGFRGDFQHSFTIVIHGGAGVIPPEDTDAPRYSRALQQILKQIEMFVLSHEVLQAVDVAEYAVRLLEDEPLFNAGRGSVFNEDGVHELEASIMEGHHLECGAVSLVTNIRHPVAVARQILEHSPHNYLIGPHVEKIAQKANLEFVDNSFFDTQRRREQLEKAKQRASVDLDHNVSLSSTSAPLTTSTVPSPSSTSPTENRKNFINDKMGTVGCVCMLNGHVAAATSTGGMTNKACGRIGDSPIIGAGTYADDRTCAVSCTGVGEIFQRYVAAYDICARMDYKKDNLVDAVRGTVYKRLPHDTGGVIAVDHYGNHAMEFNTTGMFRGMVNSLGHACVGIWAEEDYFNIQQTCVL